MQVNEISKFVQSVSNLQGRPTNMPKGIDQPQPIKPPPHPPGPLSTRAQTSGTAQASGAVQAGLTAQAGAPGADPQAEIAALESRVAALEAQLATLLSGISVAPAGGGHASAVTVSSIGSIKLQASFVDISAGAINLNNAIVLSEGFVQCNQLFVRNLSAPNFTPGAGISS